MAKPGRKPTAESTKLVQLTLPVEVEAALSRLTDSGFYGRSKSEVVVTLLSREFERIAAQDIIAALGRLSVSDNAALE